MQVNLFPPLSETTRDNLTMTSSKASMAVLLDKNQLYVNLSEIKDADFGVSEEDKVLNKAFYGE